MFTLNIPPGNVSVNITPLVHFERCKLSADNAARQFTAQTTTAPIPIKYPSFKSNVLENVTFFGFVIRETRYDPNNCNLKHEVDIDGNVVTVSENNSWLTNNTAGGYVYAIDLSQTQQRGRYLCTLDHIYRLLSGMVVEKTDAFAVTNATRIIDADERETNSLLWYKISSLKHPLIHDIIDTAEYICHGIRSLYDDTPMYTCRPEHNWGACILDLLRASNFKTLRKSELKLWTDILLDECPTMIHDAVCMLYGPIAYFKIMTLLKIKYLPKNDLDVDRIPIPDYNLSCINVIQYLAPLVKTPILTYVPTMVQSDFECINDYSIDINPILLAFRNIANVWLTFLYSDTNAFLSLQGQLQINTDFKITWDTGTNSSFKYVFAKNNASTIELQQDLGPLNALNNLLLINPRDLISVSKCRNVDWNAVFMLALNKPIELTIEIITACRIFYMFSTVDTLSIRPPERCLHITQCMRRRSPSVLRACERYDWLDFVLETITNNNKIYSADGIVKELTNPPSARDNTVGWPLFGCRQYSSDVETNVCTPLKTHMGSRVKRIVTTVSVWKNIVAKYGGYTSMPPTGNIKFSLGPVLSIVYDKFLDYDNAPFGPLYLKTSNKFRYDELIPAAIVSGKMESANDICERLHLAVMENIRIRGWGSFYTTSTANIINTILQRNNDQQTNQNVLLQSWSPAPHVWIVLKNDKVYLIRHNHFNDVVALDKALYTSMLLRWRHETRLSMLNVQSQPASQDNTAKTIVEIGTFTPILEKLYKFLIHDCCTYRFLFIELYKAPKLRVDEKIVLLLHCLLSHDLGSCMPVTNAHVKKLEDSITIQREILLSNLFGTDGNNIWSKQMKSATTRSNLNEKFLMCTTPLKYVNDVLTSYNITTNTGSGAFNNTPLSLIEVTYCIDEWLLRMTYRPVSYMTCSLNIADDFHNSDHRALRANVVQNVIAKLLLHIKTDSYYFRTLLDVAVFLTGVDPYVITKKINNTHTIPLNRYYEHLDDDHRINNILKESKNLDTLNIYTAFKLIDFLS